jgi:hypothetical protein
MTPGLLETNEKLEEFIKSISHTHMPKNKP